MFGIFDRSKLVKKGLACKKQRRQLESEQWTEVLETSVWAKFGLVVVIGLALGLLCFWGEQSAADERLSFVLMLIIYATALLLIPLDHPELVGRHSRLLLFFCIILVNLIITKTIVLVSMSGKLWLSLDARFAIYIIPSALAPMLICVLLGVGPGVLAAIFTSLFQAVLMPNSFSFLMVLGLITGLMAVIFTQNIRKRGQFIRAGFYVGLTAFIVSISLGLLGGDRLRELMQPALVAAGIGILTGIVANAILPIFEALFHTTTNVSWLELADLNHHLLQRLTMEAPGTYHHSLVVANLAEAAAFAIGANGLQCRVCAYFHDIGKLSKPDYYAENQSTQSNPHNDLTPTMSALIVLSHVKEGIDLALKYKLPASIIDAIREHHGTTLMTYFYAKAMQQQQDALAGVKIMQMREEDVPEVKEETFRYTGPKPQSRETAILMLSDAVESASRSLEKPTPTRIEEMVSNILKVRIEDGQFNECPISMEELCEVAERLTFTLKTMLHSRIAYPADEDTENKSDQSPKTAFETRSATRLA